MASRADELRAVVLELGWFSLPPSCDREVWRARWVGREGQAIAALDDDGRLAVTLEHRRPRRPPWPVLIVGPEVAPASVRPVLAAAMDAVARRGPR